METKEIKIKAPEGFVIDTDNSDLTKGIVKFKKANDRPKSWEEFCENSIIEDGESYINLEGNVLVCHRHLCSKRKNKNWCTSKEEAEAFLALMQLRQLRKAWVGDWKPTLKDHACIMFDLRYCLNTTFSCWSSQTMLSFPTLEMANDFQNCFKDLLEKAKILL